MTFEEKKEKIKKLLSNENRQPADDQELENLQREVSLAESEKKPATVEAKPAKKAEKELSYFELKRKAVQLGLKFNPVGMSREKLKKLIEEAKNK
jgi:hypothetical protein